MHDLATIIAINNRAVSLAMQANNNKPLKFTPTIGGGSWLKENQKQYLKAKQTNKAKNK